MVANFDSIHGPGRFMRAWAMLSLLLLVAQGAGAVGGYAKVEREYVRAPDAPASQSAEAMAAKSDGCQSCHTGTDQKTMHINPAVKLGCTDPAAAHVLQGPEAQDRHGLSRWRRPGKPSRGVRVSTAAALPGGDGKGSCTAGLSRCMALSFVGQP